MNGLVIWLTGLSGAGKSTIAQRLQNELVALGRSPEVLDGDQVRTHLSQGLGFSKEDRNTNVRRIGYLARLISRQGGTVVAAAISPYRETREEVRAHTPGFFEVYVRCSLEELICRDVKGLYARALRGEITNFTGIDDPYEPPFEPEVVVDTEKESIEDSVAKILRELERRNYIKRAPVDRIPAAEQREKWGQLARNAPPVQISAHDHADLFLLSTGAMAPLYGFMNQADYGAVMETGRLPSGAPFTMPIVLRVEADVVRAARSAEWLALWRQDQLVGMLKSAGAFRTDPETEAAAVYGTRDDAHPGVQLLRSSPVWALAGDVITLTRPPSAFPAYDLTPSEVRKVARQRGWRTMVGFQTRNPVHRAHEYLQKVALEIVDGLLLHPLVGKTKSDDIPASVRMRCYEALLANYYPAERTLLAANPAWMRYAGPKEAVFHAIMRRNFGCTHFIVGRDHAGVGHYYDTYAAHRIFDEYRPGELGIEILRFENAFYCRTCGNMTSARTCPHSQDDHQVMSGTQVRWLLTQGHELPHEFTRREVAAVLVAASNSRINLHG